MWSLKIFKVVFGGLKTRYRFILLWKQKRQFELLTSAHFKIWNFNRRGSPVNVDKKIVFKSDKKDSLLSEMSGEILYLATLKLRRTITGLHSLPGFRKGEGNVVGLSHRCILNPVKYQQWIMLQKVNYFCKSLHLTCLTKFLVQRCALKRKECSQLW